MRISENQPEGVINIGVKSNFRVGLKASRSGPELPYGILVLRAKSTTHAVMFVTLGAICLMLAVHLICL